MGAREEKKNIRGNRKDQSGTRLLRSSATSLANLGGKAGKKDVGGARKKRREQHTRRGRLAHVSVKETIKRGGAESQEPFWGRRTRAP